MSAPERRAPAGVPRLADQPPAGRSLGPRSGSDDYSDLRDATCTLEQSARGAADGWANQGCHAVQILLFPAMDPPGGPSATLRGQANVPHMPHVRRCRRRCRCAPSGLLPDAAAVKVTCLGTSSTVKGSLTHEFRRQHPLHNGPPAASGTARERLSGNGLERLHFLHQEIRSILVGVASPYVDAELLQGLHGEKEICALRANKTLF